MQNEELRRAHAEASMRRGLATSTSTTWRPSGYFRLDEHGIIAEANLTAAALLGVARSALVRQPLSRFVLKQDEDAFYALRKRLVNWVRRRRATCR